MGVSCGLWYERGQEPPTLLHGGPARVVGLSRDTTETNVRHMILKIAPCQTGNTLLWFNLAQIKCTCPRENMIATPWSCVEGDPGTGAHSWAQVSSGRQEREGGELVGCPPAPGLCLLYTPSLPDWRVDMRDCSCLCYSRQNCAPASLHP